MIEISNISMSYGSVKSLTDVNIGISAGSIFGLIGSNGSGKSTLLRIMSGIIRPAAGTVTYGTFPVWENPDVKKSIAYLSDEQYFLPHSDINDMKILYKTVYPSFSDEVFNNLLKIFELDGKRKINTFSKGMKKQASVILAVASRPKYLLCDETFDGLDPVIRKLVKSIIAEESAERNMTTVIASHNLREMEDICDTVAQLHKGSIICVGGVDDMKSDIYKVQAVFGGAFDPEELRPLRVTSYYRRGSMVSFIAKNTENEINAVMSSRSAIFYECVPLTLEEIFISKMEEKGYEFPKFDY